MPPRLPMLTALRGAAQPLGLRAFSTSPALSAPRDGHPTSSFSSNPSSSSSSPAAKPRSSTSSLLSLNRPNRRTPRQAQKPKDGQNDDGASTKVDAMTRMLNRYKNKARGEASNVQSAHDYLRQQKISSDYMREMPRRWEVGDVYSPHDLSPAEMSKYRRRQTRQTDVIDLMGIRPQDNYTNFSMINEFTNRTGQILPAVKTGLRPVNQRKLSKMIRRAVGMGIYPSVHAHPELLRKQFFPHVDQDI